MGLKSFSVFVGLLLLCTVSQGAETNAMRTIAKAAFSGIQEPCQVVITNAADWEKLWSRHNVKTEPKEPVPNVDFEKESVLVVAQGQKRSGGYSIEIADVRRKDGGTEVLVKSKSPKPGAMTIQALTAPIHIVAIPKATGKVEFKAE